MDLRHMRHFVAVAEELHFGKAARRLNMSQPPLSQSIRRLELDLGVDLFDRSRRGVELTAAGSVFLDEARRTLMQAELARKMTQREAAKIPEVKVSFVGPALYRVLPGLIVDYRAAVPDVHVRLYERTSAEQLAGILAGDFDIGFVTAAGVSRRGGCETLLVERAHFLAAVPADSSLAQADSVRLADLAEQPFITPPQQLAPQSLDPLAMFKSIGVMPQVTQEAIQTNTTVSLVGAGLGCSFVAATAALMPARNVKFLPILDWSPAPHWELIMTWHPEHIGSLGTDFVRFAGSYVRDNPQLLDPDTPIHCA